MLGIAIIAVILLLLGIFLFRAGTSVKSDSEYDPSKSSGGTDFPSDGV
jgi:hypothetical protein